MYHLNHNVYVCVCVCVSHSAAVAVIVVAAFVESITVPSIRYQRRYLPSFPFYLDCMFILQIRIELVVSYRFGFELIAYRYCGGGGGGPPGPRGGGGGAPPIREGGGGIPYAAAGGADTGGCPWGGGAWYDGCGAGGGPEGTP